MEWEYKEVEREGSAVSEWEESGNREKRARYRMNEKTTERGKIK